MFKLMKHSNQHGWGVSVTKYDEQDELVAGFVLNTFETKEERDQYAEDFQKMTGYEWDLEL